MSYIYLICNDSRFSKFPLKSSLPIVANIVRFKIMSHELLVMSHELLVISYDPFLQTLFAFNPSWLNSTKNTGLIQALFFVYLQ